MSTSHVVVIDSTARRAVVKVTPGTYLSDILQDACKKLKLTASQYGLKNSNKPVDLSRTIRLSGLSSGAKLELVQLSRSAAVVSVALQLPESEVASGANARLVDKFPSTTTIWTILRKFESDSAGPGAAPRNFTGRGVPKIAGGESGAGRLYYEMPVLHVMGRDLSSFPDLQKSLGQLGFNGGSTLLRLNFMQTDTPLDEAMTEIGQYFQETQDEHRMKADGGDGIGLTPAPSTGLALAPSPDVTSSTSATAHADTVDVAGMDDVTAKEERNEEQNTSQTTIVRDTVMGPGHRPMSVFSPPRNDTPQAAADGFNEADYEPTIEHAKIHQSRLSMSTRNKRLESEAEIKAQEDALAQKWAVVEDVEIKIRYPDQSQIVSKFTTADTAATLYAFVRSTIHHDTQPFLLNFASSRGPRIVPRDDAATKLIRDLGLTGRVLVNLLWDEKASAEARLSPTTLKREFAAAAEALQVQAIHAGPETDEAAEQSQLKDKPERSGSGGERKKGIPKWLKLPGKK
ncbi:MAG: hypothetical protein M1838_004446 [Thelocarpon superellum]|nr:MAG: hypothetical protein M1838_004446 [Thelocarpon superellum]